jgi:hypothetical protein
MTTFMVNISGLLLMAAIVWWFWLHRPVSPDQPDASDHVSGHQTSSVKASRTKETHLNGGKE